MKHGEGTYTFTDGTVYTGGFRDGEAIVSVSFVLVALFSCVPMSSVCETNQLFEVFCILRSGSTNTLCLAHKNIPQSY